MEPLKVAYYYDEIIYKTDEKARPSHNRELIAFFAAVIFCLSRFSKLISEDMLPYYAAVAVFVAIIYIGLRLLQHYRVKHWYNYQTEARRDKNANAVLFTFFDYDTKGYFSAVTCARTLLYGAVSSKLADLPKGYRATKEMVYTYDSIKTIIDNNDKYLITVPDDNFIILKKDCSQKLIDFLNNLAERTGK